MIAFPAQADPVKADVWCLYVMLVLLLDGCVHNSVHNAVILY